MNEHDYQKWEKDARLALSGRYSNQECDKILNWFRTIKSSKEQDLMGAEGMTVMQNCMALIQPFDLYATLMVRLFVYAPKILALGPETIAMRQGDSTMTANGKHEVVLEKGFRDQWFFRIQGTEIVYGGVTFYGDDELENHSQHLIGKKVILKKEQQ